MLSMKKAALSAAALMLLGVGVANAAGICIPKKAKRVRCPQPVPCNPCAIAYRQTVVCNPCPPANPCPPVNPCQAVPAKAPAIQYVYVQAPVQAPAPAVRYVQAPAQVPVQVPAVQYVQAPVQAPAVQYVQTAVQAQASVQEPVIVAHPPETMPRSMMPVRFVIGTEHMPVPTLANPARPLESSGRYVRGPEFPVYPATPAAPAIAALPPTITASPVVALPPSAAESCAPCGQK